MAAVVAVALRDPHEAGSWGVCPVLALTGLQCPGCGGLRALNDLAHLRVTDALSSNAMGVLAMAVAAAAWAVWLRARVRGVPSGLDRWVTPTSASVLLVAMVVFAVLRNTAWGGVLAP